MVTLVNVPRYVALMKNYSSKPMLTKWLGKDGEPVEEGQPLVVVETTIRGVAGFNVYVGIKAAFKRFDMRSQQRLKWIQRQTL